MKITGEQLKEANDKLKSYGLELGYLNLTKRTVKCFVTSLKPTEIQLENMRFINSEITNCKNYSDIKYMPYFQ